MYFDIVLTILITGIIFSLVDSYSQPTQSSKRYDATCVLWAKHVLLLKRLVVLAMFYLSMV